MSDKDLVYEGLVLELRRGTLVLSVLGQLREKKYGYSLVQDLKSNGLEIDQSTLYPLLRRLEKQGLLKSDWSLEESRPRRYYVLSEEGQNVLEKLKQAWNEMVAVMKSVLD
ncbi:MAG: PadR family transcriptional regulator [Clostridia bacterium]|nr:PadR family transcriptional regulator [Clostridia bacterium]